MRRLLLPFALCLLPLLASAQDAEPRHSLTVYAADDHSPGFAVVRDVRKLALVKGDNVIRFADVAGAIDPTTVSFRSLTAPDSTAVIEQSFEYDLSTPDKLLEKYVGKSIIVNRKQVPLPTDRTRMPETIEARLLSFTADQLVLLTNNKQLPIQIIPRNSDIAEIKLFDMPGGLVTRPTLVWNVQAEQAGEHEVEATYQADGIGWRADYTLVVNKEDTKADLSSWMSLTNDSGISFNKAQLKLIAGDVHRARRAVTVQRAYVAEMASEKELAEYHMYKMPRPVSIAAGSTKQMELFTAKSNLPISKTYVYNGIGERWRAFAQARASERDLGLEANRKVDVYLEMKNGIGGPMPGGRVRVYKRDIDDRDAPLEFIGEDAIDHTPRDEPARVRIGSAFDIAGERRQTSFNVDVQKKVMTESFAIKLRNHKKEAARVLVRERLYRAATWEITNESDRHEKVDARTIQLPVDVPAGGEKTVTYTVHYSW